MVVAVFALVLLLYLSTSNGKGKVSKQSPLE